MGLWDATVGRLFRPKAELTSPRDLETILLSLNSETASGVSVTPEKALGMSAVAAAVAVLSESVAQLPLLMYRRMKPRGKERASDHPLWRVLHVKPNPWQDAFQFREMMQAHLLLSGNCFAIKNIAGGMVRELLPVHYNAVSIEQDENYSVWYDVALADGQKIRFPKDRIFHVMDRSLDGVRGLSRVRLAREAIGLGLKTEKHGALLFGNGARPSGILTTDQVLTTEQVELIKTTWKDAHGGDNALGTALLDHGFKFEPLSFTSEDSQFLETRKFQIAEVSRIFRVPPHMLGDLDRATFSNIEHQSLEFVTHSLMPWLRRWEHAINTQLVADRKLFFAEFLVDGLLRGDVKSRFEAYQIALMNGWMNVNEVRELENRNPIDGGDEYRQAESQYGGENGQDQAATGDDDDPAPGVRPDAAAHLHGQERFRRG